MVDTVDTYKLPVKNIFIEALQLPGRHMATLIRIGSPFLIVVLASTIVNHFFQYDSVENSSLNFIGFIIISAIIFVVTLVMAIVGCHRTFLMDHKDVAETKAIRWGGRETRFIGWTIVIGLCAALIAIPLMMVLRPFFLTLHNSSSENFFFLRSIRILIGLPTYYFISRWSLLLPATATDNRYNFSWSWYLSKGNGIRLTVLVGLLPFATELLFELMPTYDSLLYSLFTEAAWLVIAVIEIGVLSLSYQYLSQNIVQQSDISE